MKSIFTAVALAATVALPTVSAQAAPYTSYYAFGDSLTDDGKLGLPEPYFEGRFSSGPVWADFITKRFEKQNLDTFNFALGGATAGDVNTNVYPPAALPFATFGEQINTFTNWLPGLVPGSNPLISVLFGANDIFQGGSPVDAAKAVVQGIETLVNLDPAVFNDFLISDLPPLPGPDGRNAKTAFDMELANGLAGISGVNFINISQDDFNTQLLPQLPGLGVTVFDAPCLVPGVSDCTIIGVDENGDFIRDLSIADTYFFIDEVHPSGPIQAAFGEFAIDLVRSDLPPVPLPAGAPLLLAGLGAFAWMRRRGQARAVNA